MKLRINKTVGAVAAAGLALVAIGATMSPASADPTGAPTFRALAGGGSDTTFNVLNGLSNVAQVGGTLQIGSYDPIPAGRLVSPKSTPGCTNIPSPNGSSAGRTQLLNSLTPGNAVNGCWDFARSSSLSLGAVPAVTGGLTYVPFATDGFTYGVLKDSVIPRDLTLADLQDIYQCDPVWVNEPTDAVPGLGVEPFVPQVGSGTRQYWLAQMGIAEGAVNTTCVRDNRAAAPYQENDYRFVVNNDEIVPASIANFVAQNNQAQADLRGSIDLGNTAGKGVLAAADVLELSRSVYNVIPTNKIGVSPWSDVFVGSGSQVCTNTATIKKYGFGTNASCGSTTNQTPLS